MPNAGNFRMIPGQLIPGGLQAVTLPPPPVSFDQEMTSTRTVAEYNIGLPDYSLAQDAVKGGHRTATEIQQVAGLLNVTLELRGRTFRMALGRLLRLAWSTLVQYDTDSDYHLVGELRKLPRHLLIAEAWKLEPSGSAESWNRGAQLQRAIHRKELFAGAPWIDQRELDRSILELDDPRLVRRLLLPPGAAPAATDRAATTFPLSRAHALVRQAQTRPAVVPMPPNAAPFPGQYAEPALATNPEVQP
jgi:hypothetical protein